MATIKSYTDLRYQVYSLGRNGDLYKPITRPILTRERANKYFSDCIQCAIVSIDEYGSIVEIIEKNTELIKANNKSKTIKRKI